MTLKKNPQEQFKNLYFEKQIQELSFVLKKYKKNKYLDLKESTQNNQQQLQFNSYISRSTKNELNKHLSNIKNFTFHHSQKNLKQNFDYQNDKEKKSSYHQKLQKNLNITQNELKIKQLCQNSFLKNLNLKNYNQIKTNNDTNISVKRFKLIQKEPIKKYQTQQSFPKINFENIYYINKVIKSLDNFQFDKFFDHFENVLEGIKLFYLQNNKYYDQLQNKRVSLSKNPIYSGKKTLIFDLDETIIHTQQNVNQKDFDVNLIFKINNNQKSNGMNIRPFATQTLKKLSKNFEIIIFTASMKHYANPIIDYLDPQKNIISHRLYRDSCIVTNQQYFVKDLRIINRNLKDMIIIDNQGYSFSFQIDNGIPILNFYNDKNDTEFLDLELYLNMLIDVDDIREFNKRHFQLSKILEYKDIKQAIKQIYGK